MPRTPELKTVRELAQARALKTIAAVDTPVYNEQDSPQPEPVAFIPQNFGKLPEQTEENTLPEIETAVSTIVDQDNDDGGENEVTSSSPLSNPPKRRGRGPNKPKEPEQQAEQSLKRGIGEGFLEYQARIPANEWVSNVYGNYIYKLVNGKKKRVEDQPRLQPITMGDLREIAAQHGPGDYYVQFTVKTPNLSSCFETFTIDDDGRGTIGSSTFSKNDPEGIAYSAKVAADITKEAAREGLAMVREERVERNKQPDIAALVTALAGALAPKQSEDKTLPLIMKMLENQATEAQRRADAAERRAEEQRRADREDAERRERQAKEESERARERDKQFFDMMLAQANGKADSLNQFTGLLSNFLKVKNEIDDTMGGGPKGPWDLAGSVLDGVIQQGPAIVAALKGASPQQVQQMQNPQAQPQANPDAQPFYEMVVRLAKYFQRDPANYDGEYLVSMIEEEYGAVFSEIINQPKDDVLKAIANFEPYGKAIMDHEKASDFMGKVIDVIKGADIDDVFSEEPQQTQEPIVLHGKARKVNAKEKSA